MKLNWRLKKFEELSTMELYTILQLRLAVFSVEQNCAYQDVDGKDIYSLHLMGENEKGELLAYARIVPAGISFAEVSIGRVITAAVARGTGAGKALMKEALATVVMQFGKVPVRIGAQCYLIKFYQSFGFEIAGEEYLEDNIPHIEMLYKPK